VLGKLRQWWHRRRGASRLRGSTGVSPTNNCELVAGKRTGLISSGAVRCRHENRKSTYHAFSTPPGKVSKASWVFLQRQKAPVREHARATIVSHAGSAASVPNRGETEFRRRNRKGKTAQSIVSSRRCRVERMQYLTCRRHEIATIARCITAAARLRSETRTTAGVGCR
jgi:prophage tail gpP-like protein